MKKSMGVLLELLTHIEKARQEKVSPLLLSHFFSNPCSNDGTTKDFVKGFCHAISEECSDPIGSNFFQEISYISLECQADPLLNRIPEVYLYYAFLYLQTSSATLSDKKHFAHLLYQLGDPHSPYAMPLVEFEEDETNYQARLIKTLSEWADKKSAFRQQEALAKFFDLLNGEEEKMVNETIATYKIETTSNAFVDAFLFLKKEDGLENKKSFTFLYQSLYDTQPINENNLSPSESIKKTNYFQTMIQPTLNLLVLAENNSLLEQVCANIAEKLNVDNELLIKILEDGSSYLDEPESPQEAPSIASLH